MSPISDSFAPFATLLIKPAQALSNVPPPSYCTAHTRKIAERQVRDIAPADLQTHTVSRERQLRGGGVLVRAVQEVRRARARVERCPLRAPDALFNAGLVEDDVAKGFVARGAKGLAARVGDKTERDDTLPGLFGPGEAALGWTSAWSGASATTAVDRGRGLADLPRARPYRSRERDPGDGFYERGFPCALAADDGNNRKVDVPLHTAMNIVSTPSSQSGEPGWTPSPSTMQTIDEVKHLASHRGVYRV